MVDISAVFIYFFAVIDPIGTIPVFLAVTKGEEKAAKRKVALFATCAAAVILIFFVVAGEYILSQMQIRLAAFEVAGGLVLLLFALSMIFGESKPEEEVRMAKNASDSAIFPLAIPSIAGPGAMLAAVLLTEKSRYGTYEQFVTVAVMLSVLLCGLVLLLAAELIHRVIGSAGASIVSRVMGFILAASATSSILEGIRKYFNL